MTAINSFFQKFSIKLRFNVLIMSIIALLFFIVIFFIFTLSEIQYYRNYNQTIDKLTIHYLNMRRFEQHFLLRYHEDPAFFTTGKNKYLKKHENSSEKFVTTLDVLSKKSISEELHLDEDLSKIAIFHNRYNEIFDNLAAKIYQRGSKKSGVVGELETASGLSYKTAENLKVKEYVIRLIQIYENYLYNTDIKYYQNFLIEFKKLNNYIEFNFSNDTNNVSPENIANNTIAGDSTLISSFTKINKNFVKNINDFKYQFTFLLKVDKEIGMSYKEGLSGELRSEIHKVDTPLDRVSRNVNIRQEEEVKKILGTIYMFFGLITGLIILILWRFSKSITTPLGTLKEYIQPLSIGKLPEKLSKTTGKDEIFEMTQSLNELISGLKKTTNFATLIGKGVFDTKYEPLSNEDALGNSLIEMRQNLNKAKIEENKRKREDDMRKWSNEGLAKFNDITRQSTGDIDLLSNTVIKELVHFLNANQGGLFVYNNNNSDDIYLELTASYAYGHEKKRQKKIYPGEGLVGTAAVEKETIYMTDIPDSYIVITSGLGGANPRSLLIVPMRVEEEVFGVIEIASFNEFRSHEIEFAERVSESIAASLSITRINTRTAELLEQSQMQAEQMAAQEEEMRQNFEELQQAQEESAKREAEMTSILEAIESSSLVFELNIRGYITLMNQLLLDSLAIQEREIIGKHHQYLFKPDDDDKYNRFWRILRSGKHVQQTEHLLYEGKEFWFSVIYAPIIDGVGNIQKILCLAGDLTEHKKLEIELIEQAKAMSEQEEEMRQNLEELHTTQEEMDLKQSLLEEVNYKSKINEKILRKAIETTRNQENELKQKVNELSEIHKQLHEQNNHIIAINRGVVKTESEMKDRFSAIDKNNLVAEFSLQGITIFANNTFLKTFGYERKDIIGKHHRMFVYNEDKKSPEYKNFWKSLRQGETFDNEYRRVNKAGNLLFFRGIYVPISDLEGRPYKILEILTENTQLKNTEAESISRMENINSTNVVIEFDMKGNILSANKLFCKAVGYTESELTGKNHKIFMNKNESEHVSYRHFWRALGRGENRTNRFSLLSKNNKKVFLQGTYSPIKNPQGNIIKIMFVAYDLTKTVIETEKIIAQKNELELKIKELEK